MPLTRVVTTDKCSAHLRVGNTTLQPSRDEELDMSDEDVVLVTELATTALAGMIASVGSKNFLTVERSASAPAEARSARGTPKAE
jgi:hypothetical protein